MNDFNAQNDPGPMDWQALRNRFRMEASRMVNGMINVVPALSHGPRRVHPKAATTAVPLRAQSAMEWHFEHWNASSYLEVAPAYRGVLPRKTMRFPHPALDAAAQAEGWVKGPFEIPTLFVIEIPYGRTIGRHGAVVTPDRTLLTDLSREFRAAPGDHSLLHTATLPPRLSRRKGRYALLHGPGNSPFHFLYDALPRIEVLRRAGFEIGDFDGFLVSKPKYQAYYATFDRLGIPREKILWCSRKRHVECESLVVASFPNNGREHHPITFPFLRALSGLDLPELARKRRRLFISRKDAATASRRIVNEEALLPLLEKFGFERVTLGHLSFQEQAALFASAECIASPHGAGLSNLCFCSPPARLLEIFAPDTLPTFYRSLALQLGLRYEALVGEKVASPHATVPGEDIRVDPDQLEILLREMV